MWETTNDIEEDHMNKKTILSVLLTFVLILALIPKVYAQQVDKVIMHYRIELMDKNRWKPVKDTKRFKKKQTVRFRFMVNCAGTLYVLNNSTKGHSLEPVFPEGSDEGLKKHLGLGTFIDANQVGIFPDPYSGGGLRFTGVKGYERFIFVFVPDEMEYTRAMAAIAAGAENWQFDAKTTNKAYGNPGKVMFHYFELKSR